MKCSVIREIDSLDRIVRSEGQLNCAVVQGLDLREANLPWTGLDCDGAVFLGCRFPVEISVCDLIDKGALVFPEFPDLPFNPYRPELYTRQELMEGWTEEDDQ
ncbi:MAG: Rossmann fold nucleotide-binding protein, partial [Akkermansiaceae bacterium]